MLALATNEHSVLSIVPKSGQVEDGRVRCGCAQNGSWYGYQGGRPLNGRDTQDFMAVCSIRCNIGQVTSRCTDQDQYLPCYLRFNIFSKSCRAKKDLFFLPNTSATKSAFELHSKHTVVNTYTSRSLDNTLQPAR